MSCAATLPVLRDGDGVGEDVAVLCHFVRLFRDVGCHWVVTVIWYLLPAYQPVILSWYRKWRGTSTPSVVHDEAVAIALRIQSG
jgi:hypothetical protein